MSGKAKSFFRNRGVLLMCLILQLLVYWVCMAYSPLVKELVAYQRF